MANHIVMPAVIDKPKEDINANSIRVQKDFQESIIVRDYSEGEKKDPVSFF